MGLREAFSVQLKESMKAGDGPRTSTLRMMLAKIKDADIASRTQGHDSVALSDDALIPILRSMVKSRRESVVLYQQGNRADLAEKETIEIAIIEGFLPQQMDEAGLETAVAEAVAESGATTPRDMGRVMAALKARHGSSLDMGRATPLVKAKLAG